ncbi:MAG: LytTR family transcriptional regulator DNA-binding domain-containing protein [Bacteroidetes bacterium]|nr:LytTR family transcriptional regulator DNA-binding domain-containing protein [Bacteroidota bacterium]MBS1539653.1 LytTR family transcriptional regulator DNA-binding domain-containing protein [Bacteroidota bacterium]
MNWKSIRLWLSTPFFLLDPPRARVELVLFCAVFGCIFLNLFHPLNLDQWFVHANQPIYFILISFSVVGLVANLVTQFALRSFFKERTSTRLSFFVWVIVDYVVIALAAHVANHFITHDPLFDFTEFSKTLINTFLILILPYSLGLLLLSLRDKVRTVEALTLKINQLAQPARVEIKDENGKTAMTVDAKNILYFKSEDNYVFVYYKVDEEIKKELVRTSLKRLEHELGTEPFVRIHRSYMINTLNLVAATRSSGGYRVVIDTALKVTFPVSSSYQSIFEERLLSKSL